MYPLNAVQISPTHSSSEENSWALWRPESNENLHDSEALSTTLTMQTHPTSPGDSNPHSRLTEAVDKSLGHCENMQSTKHVARVRYALRDLAARFHHDNDDDALVCACGYVLYRKLI